MSLLVSAAALVGVLIAGRMATGKFTWWKEASFAGRVVGKEAIWRETGEPADPAAALAKPSQCQFFLEIAEESRTATHEVTLSMFRAVEVGDHVVKAAGTFEWRRGPASGRAGAQPEHP